ncbi:MAG: SDR family NAD(P)-dependent oxidoreductase [Acidobacteriota bacterium]
MNGQRAAIVGGTSGLGRAIARWLAAQGATVTVVGRTFRDRGTDGIDFIQADLSTVAEQRRVATQLPAEDLGLLVFTTGILSPKRRETSDDGVEIDLAVSYLSRFVILRGVAESLGANLEARARVFVMGAPGSNVAGNPSDLNSEERYAQLAAHTQTVAANEALVLDATSRYPEIGVYGLNPGLVATGDIRAPFLGGSDSLRFKVVEWLIGKLSPSADEYAARIGPTLVAAELDAESGLIFDSRARRSKRSQKLTPERVADFMRATEELLADLPRP